MLVAVAVSEMVLLDSDFVEVFISCSSYVGFYILSTSKYNADAGVLV